MTGEWQESKSCCSENKLWGSGFEENGDKQLFSHCCNWQKWLKCRVRRIVARNAGCGVQVKTATQWAAIGRPGDAGSAGKTRKCCLLPALGVQKKKRRNKERIKLTVACWLLLLAEGKGQRRRRRGGESGKLICPSAHTGHRLLAASTADAPICCVGRSGREQADKQEFDSNATTTSTSIVKWVPLPELGGNCMQNSSRQMCAEEVVCAESQKENEAKGARKAHAVNLHFDWRRHSLSWPQTLLFLKCKSCRKYKMELKSPALTLFFVLTEIWRMLMMHTRTEILSSSCAHLPLFFLHLQTGYSFSEAVSVQASRQIEFLLARKLISRLIVSSFAVIHLVQSMRTTNWNVFN